MQLISEGSGRYVNGLYIERHGGGCCGVNHLYGFPSLTDAKYAVNDDKRVEWIKLALENVVIDNYDVCECENCDGDCGYPASNTFKCAIEVILSAGQLAEWRGPLETSGFKEVFDFYNSNSGNQCHVFYLQTNAE